MAVYTHTDQHSPPPLCFLPSFIVPPTNQYTQAENKATITVPRRTMEADECVHASTAVGHNDTSFFWLETVLQCRLQCSTMVSQQSTQAFSAVVFCFLK